MMRSGKRVKIEDLVGKELVRVDVWHINAPESED